MAATPGERSVAAVNTSTGADAIRQDDAVHFIFVPMSIGLAGWVALCQNAVLTHRQGRLSADDEVLGKFFLISMGSES